VRVGEAAAVAVRASALRRVMRESCIIDGEGLV
jgi:hypothetical protein